LCMLLQQICMPALNSLDIAQARLYAAQARLHAARARFDAGHARLETEKSFAAPLFEGGDLRGEDCDIGFDLCEIQFAKPLRRSELRLQCGNPLLKAFNVVHLSLLWTIPMFLFCSKMAGGNCQGE